MSKKKVSGVFEKVSTTNIKEHASIVGRANGTTALASAKVVTSILGRWALIKKIKTQLGITYLMSFQIEDGETEFPIIDSLKAKESYPQLPFEAINSLASSEESDSPYKSISDYHRAYKAKTASPTNIVEKIIEFYNSAEPQVLNAVYEFHAEEMREAAKESERRFNEGEERSILEGVPFVVKEELKISGYKCVKGMCQNDAVAETETYPLVKRLLEAGAILVGTTKMSQLGFGTIGSNPAENYGTVKNPYNSKFYTGGSSGGTAAAVSSGLVPFGIAVDGLGSGRIPAALTGIIGFKPTFGRVANYGKMAESPYTAISPMVSSVRDAAIVYGFISGAYEGDKNSVYQPAVELPELSTDFDLKSVRFGFEEEFTKACYNESIIQAVSGVYDYLKKEGYNTCLYNIPEMQESIAAMSVSIIRKNQQLSEDKFGSKVESMINCVNSTVIYTLAKCLDEKELAQSRKQRTRAIQIVKEMFGAFDILITASIGAFPKVEDGDEKYGILDDITTSRLIRYSALGSLTGIPSIVLNIGVTEEKMPISLQLSAAWWNEKLLLNVAYVLEKVFNKKQGRSEFFNSTL